MATPTLTITLGADPEVFLYQRDESTDALTVVPVCGWLGGSKMAPEVLDPKYPKYCVQEDGIAAEYNIPPCRSAPDFADAIMVAGRLLRARVAERRPGTIANVSPYVVVKRSELIKHPEAYIFGCSPEFDAYGEGAEVPRIVPEQLVLESSAGLDDPEEYRFAGGHVHIGATRGGKYALPIPKYVLAAFCDAYLGLWAVPYDPQGARRAMYGQAGRFRPTKYGIEYRVLSNFWTASEGLADKVAHMTLSLLDVLSRNDVRVIMQIFDTIPWGAVRQAINSEDGYAARDLLTFITSEVYREVA